MDYFKGKMFQLANPHHPRHGEVGLAVTDATHDHLVCLRMKDGTHVQTHVVGLIVVDASAD